MGPTLTRALLATAGLLLTAPAADAAVVQLRSLDADGDAVAQQLQVVTLPDEANVLALSQPGDGTIAVTDSAAPLTPGRGCAGGGAEVRCTPQPGALVTIVVGGGASGRSVSLAQMREYERSELWGSDGADTLAGGPRRDDLYGYAGDDVLTGDGGRDRLDPGTGADVLRGGPGVDLAWYVGGSALTVTLGGTPLAGADDVGVDVEDVAGGDAADRIVGSDVANVLSGGRGADEIDGRGGNDRITSFGSGARLAGGAGRDVISTNRGRVSVETRDGERDRVRCPNGLARAPLADAIDRLDRCVPLVSVTTRRVALDAAGRLRVPLLCRAVDQPCLVRLTVRHRGSQLARRTMRMQAGKASFSVALRARGRRPAGSLCIVAQSYRTTPAPSEARGGCHRVELVRAP